MYCKAVTPAGPHKGWGGRVNQPIACGPTVVRPGDVVVGDGDGIVVVPRELAAETVVKARAKHDMESQWFAKVAEGGDTAVFLGFVEVAKRYGIEVV